MRSWNLLSSIVLAFAQGYIAYADQPGEAGVIQLEVVLENINRGRRTISARSWNAQTRPRPGVGGIVEHGTRKTDGNVPGTSTPTRLHEIGVADQAILLDAERHPVEFEQLPPEMHAVLSIKVNEHGLLMVTRLEEVQIERIGVRWIDALPGNAAGPAMSTTNSARQSRHAGRGS